MNNKALLKTIDKYKAFYKDDSPGQILAYISPPYNFEIDYTPYGIDERPLNQWNFDNEADAYVDTEVKKLRAYMLIQKTWTMIISLPSAHLLGLVLIALIIRRLKLLLVLIQVGPITV